MATDKIGLEHDTLTPITKQPIQQVRGDKWHDMPLTELWEQKAILQGRLVLAAGTGNQSLVMQIQRGIYALEELIASKATSDSDLKLL